MDVMSHSSCHIKLCMFIAYHMRINPSDKNPVSTWKANVVFIVSADVHDPKPVSATLFVVV